MIGEHRRVEPVVVGLEHARGFFVAGIAAAQGQVPAVVECIFKVGVSSNTGGVHSTAHVLGQAVGEHGGQDVFVNIQHRVETALGMAVVVVDAGYQVGVVAVPGELEFLGELVILVVGRHVEIRTVSAVEIDIGVGVALALGSDGLEAQAVRDGPVGGQRHAAVFHRVVGGHVGAMVIDAAGRGFRSPGGVDHQVTETRIGIVLGAVGGQADPQGVGRIQFERYAPAQYVLVIVFRAGHSVFTVAVVLRAGYGKANVGGFGKAGLASDYQVALVVRADTALDSQFGITG